MKKLTVVFLFVLTTFGGYAQKKNISLENIFKNPLFSVKGVYGLVSMNDGLHYSTLKDGKILKYEYANVGTPEQIVDQNELNYNGKKISINKYSFTKDETKILIASEIEIGRAHV